MMSIKNILFQLRKRFNSPIKATAIITPFTIGVSLGMEWLLTGVVTATTVWIAGVVTFVVTYFVTAAMFKYQQMLDEKNRQLLELTDELRQTNAVILSQNKDLDAFSHTVAHALKAPLSVIIGYSHLLGHEQFNTNPERIRDASRQITQTSLKMNNIIQEMLLLASLRQDEEVQVEPLDMDSIVAETLKQLESVIAEEKASLKKPKNWPTVNGHRPWIEEVWSNYIGNALKYGGRNPNIEIGADAPKDGQVRFWVKDHGKGLTAEQQANAFNQFTRFNSADIKGHGLGLSISRQIIEKLGGEVGVESQLNRGSTFYFTLPSA